MLERIDEERNIQIEMPQIYDQVIRGKNGFYLIPGGRISGKSKNACITTILQTYVVPNSDIIVARANYVDIETSLYNELIDVLQETNMIEFFKVYKQPLRIERKNGGSVIYFTGINGKNGDRTKGIKTKHDVSMILFDEAQEISTQNEYEQALASFRRRLNTDNWKIITLFNPLPQNAHWLNIYYNMKKSDNDYVCLEPTTYLDILKFINDIDLKEILKDKRYNLEHYNWFYLGQTTGAFGSVYPMFHKEKHLLTPEQAIAKFSKEKIIGMIIGCDGAVVHDAVSFVPIAIMSSGRAVVLKIFHHEPTISGVFGSQVLVEQYGSIWFNQLRKEFNLDDRNAFVPIMFVVDSASTELIQAFRYYFGDRADILPYRDKSVLPMVDVVQGVIAKNMCYIINYGGYQDYVLNKWVKCENPLAVALQNLIWNDKQTGYDKSVPNDDSDAFTYGINMWYKNPENIHWLDILKSVRKDYYEI